MEKIILPLFIPQLWDPILWVSSHTFRESLSSDFSG